MYRPIAHLSMSFAMPIVLGCSLGGGILHAQTASPPTIERVTVTGVINFAKEFSLVIKDGNKNPNGSKCISGYFFPPEKQKEYYKYFNGKSVQISGKLIRYSDLPADNPLSYSRRYISNTCEGNFVIIGEAIKAEP